AGARRVAAFRPMVHRGGNAARRADAAPAGARGQGARTTDGDITIRATQLSVGGPTKRQSGEKGERTNRDLFDPERRGTVGLERLVRHQIFQDGIRKVGRGPLLDAKE